MKRLPVAKLIVLCLATVGLTCTHIAVAREKRSAEQAAQQRVSASRMAEGMNDADEPLANDIEQLIGRLTDVAVCDIGYAPNVTGAKFSPLDDRKPPSRFYETVFPASDHSNPTIRRLVEFGTAAVPHLVKHLDDRRETRVPVGPVMFSLGGVFFLREYDYNRRTVEKPPKGVVHPEDCDLLDEDEEDLPDEGDERRVTVGDLCFVALGQIVNREFNAVRYQPTGCVIVNSPAYSATLRAAIVQEWGDLNTAKHRASLTADVRKPDSVGRAAEAFRRLSYYFPDAVEPLALEQLRKPRHCSWLSCRFARDVLYQTDSPLERERLFDEFIESHGEAFKDGLLLQLVADHDWEEWQPRLEVKADPRDVREQFFPGIDATKHLYVESQSLEGQAALIDALAWHPSEKIDHVIYAIFKSLGQGKFEPMSEDDLALACIRRLAGKEHDGEFENYLEKRIPRIPQEHEWRADRLKEMLASLRGETFHVRLDGEEVNDAELVHLHELKNLHRLTLTGPRITDARLAHLESLTTLEWLALSGDEITDAGLIHLSRLNNLETLFLAGPQITDGGLVHLKSLIKLRYLDLSGVKVTDAGLVHLAGLTRLKRLLLKGFINETRTSVTEEGVKRLQHTLSDCMIDR